MTITTKDLKTIKTDLVVRRQARLAAADDRSLSGKEIILKLAPELRRMKRQGFTTAELVETLKAHGLHIKGATLNRYLSEGQPPKVGSTGGRRKNQPAAPQPDQKEDEACSADAPSMVGRHEATNPPDATS